MKTVDICIPVYKPGDDLRKLLYRICRQTYPVSCIRIVNTKEEYWDEDYLKEPERRGIPVELIHIKKEEFDHGATRDFVARASKADLVLFMTQDAYPKDDNLIASLVSAFDDEQVAAAYARQLPKPGCGALERENRLFNYPEVSEKKSRDDIPRLGIKTYFCSNVCAMYDVRRYKELSGFCGHLIFNEDMIFAHRIIKAGYFIAYVAEAKVFHSHNMTLRQYFKRSFDMAVSQKQHPEVFASESSEKEGLRLVRVVCGRLIKEGQAWKIFPFGMQCMAKYAGFFLGKHYERLPRCVIRACTDNKNFWEN